MSGDGNTGRGKGKAWEATASQSLVEDVFAGRYVAAGKIALFASAQAGKAGDPLMAALQAGLAKSCFALEATMRSRERRANPVQPDSATTTTATQSSPKSSEPGSRGGAKS